MSHTLTQHEQFMDIALNEALKAKGFTKPNPLVGAILVKNNKIIAKDHHRFFGEAHAERNLLSQDGVDPKGATLYCTLEPCCHVKKKTPPCNPLIMNSGIKEVIIAMKDPNPLVNGKSFERLKEKSIKVISSVREEKAREINQAFIKSVTKKTPYIHVKVAQTLDGKMCLENGKSQWITHSDTKKDVHQLRSLYQAIGVSGKTFRADNPSLNVRISPFQDHLKFQQPRPLVISSKPIETKRDILKIERKLLTKNHWIEELERLKSEENIQSLFLEPGPKLFGELLKHGLCDKITIYIAPKIMGKGQSLSCYDFEDMNQLQRFSKTRIKVLENSDTRIDIYSNFY